MDEWDNIVLLDVCPFHPKGKNTM